MPPAYNVYQCGNGECQEIVVLLAREELLECPKCGGLEWLMWCNAKDLNCDPIVVVVERDKEEARDAISAGS